MPVPVFPREHRQLATQLLTIQILPVGRIPATEQIEKVFELQVTNRSQLQFEQRILLRIHIHRMHPSRLVEQIIQGITSRGSDHHDLIIRSEF